MSRVSSSEKGYTVLLIDGKCLLCNGITRFVAKRDRTLAFRFASLQSIVGQQLLVNGHLSTEDIDTFVMVKDGQYYTKSDAALRVFRKLGGLWPLLYIFIIVPTAWRNVIYDLVAKNRYRWFGRRELCLLPSAELKERFLANGIDAGVKGEEAYEERTDLR